MTEKEWSVCVCVHQQFQNRTWIKALPNFGFCHDIRPELWLTFPVTWDKFLNWWWLARVGLWKVHWVWHLKSKYYLYLHNQAVQKIICSSTTNTKLKYILNGETRGTMVTLLCPGSCQISKAEAGNPKRFTFLFLPFALTPASNTLNNGDTANVFSAHIL